MELNYLVYFRTVAKTQHISQAAQQLHITQPALSRAISRLEETVGTPLFERGANSIRLNHAGRLFLRRVEQILSEYDDAIREVSDNSGAETGSVKLVAPTLELVSGFLRQYLPQHPRMQVFHQLAGHDTTVQELETHGADFALCPEPEGAPRIQWQPLFREDYCLMVSAQHPLAQRRTVELAELQQERFIFNHGSSDFTQQTRDFCCRAGFEPQVAFMGDETAFAPELVVENLGVMLVPVSHQDLRQNPLLRYYQAGLRFLPLTDRDCSRTIGLAQLKNGYLSRTAAATQSALTDYYRALSDLPGLEFLA